LHITIIKWILFNKYQPIILLSLWFTFFIWPSPIYIYEPICSIKGFCLSILFPISLDSFFNYFKLFKISSINSSSPLESDSEIFSDRTSILSFLNSLVLTSFFIFYFSNLNALLIFWAIENQNESIYLEIVSAFFN